MITFHWAHEHFLPLKVVKSEIKFLPPFLLLVKMYENVCNLINYFYKIFHKKREVTLSS